MCSESAADIVWQRPTHSMTAASADYSSLLPNQPHHPGSKHDPKQRCYPPNEYQQQRSVQQPRQQQQNEATPWERVSCIDRNRTRQQHKADRQREQHRLFQTVQHIFPERPQTLVQHQNDDRQQDGELQLQHSNRLLVDQLRRECQKDCQKGQLSTHNDELPEAQVTFVLAVEEGVLQSRTHGQDSEHCAVWAVTLEQSSSQHSNIPGTLDMQM